MKRCQFCGWPNPQANTTCEKCGSPLDGKGATVAKAAERPVAEAEAPAKAPAKEPKEEAAPVSKRVTLSKTQVWHKGTLKPNRRKSPRQAAAAAQPAKVDTTGKFSLMMMPDDDEDFMPYARQFEGHEVVLNRANTEGTNKTITGKEQAVLLNIDNKWYIEDHSEMKTTFVRSGHRIELHSGDMILMGDRVFRFDDLNAPAEE